MRTEDFNRKENEDNKTYFTRLAKLIRELKAEGKETEAAKAYSVVYQELCPIIKQVVECESRFYHLDDTTTYGYLKRADDVIAKTFHRYNDTEDLKDKEKQYGIRSKSDPLKTAYNKKTKVMKVLAELGGRISMEDVEGCLTLYVKRLWKQILDSECLNEK